MNTRSIIRVVAILLLNLCLLYATFSQTTVAVSPVSGTPLPLARYAVDVVVNNGLALHAAHATVSFDAAVLRLDSIKQGPFLTGSTFFSFTPSTLGPGVSSVMVDQAILGLYGIDGGGSLFKLYFTSLQPGSSALTLNSVSLRDTGNVSIPPSLVAGSVTVLTPLVGVTAFLEGTYVSATTSMRNTLKTGGVLATRFPGILIPGSAVDSVNIEIRNNASAAAATVRRFAPAWLLTNGTLRNFNDTTVAGVAFDAPAGAYYVVVRHRNHLAIMSNATVALNTSPVSNDFTSAMSAAFGTNPMKTVVGRFVLFAGDASADGQVTSPDFDVFNPKFRSAAIGYEISDWNLDGQVTSPDFDLFNPNFRAAAVSQVPN